MFLIYKSTHLQNKFNICKALEVSIHAVKPCFVKHFSRFLTFTARPRAGLQVVFGGRKEVRLLYLRAGGTGVDIGSQSNCGCGARALMLFHEEVDEQLGAVLLWLFLFPYAVAAGRSRISKV